MLFLPNINVSSLNGHWETCPAELGRETEDYGGWLGHVPQGSEGGMKVMGQVKLGID